MGTKLNKAEQNQLSIAVKSAIDLACEQGQNFGWRTHLGASLIGNKCSRFIWYSFRWCFKVEFDGRMQRLFSRGHEEEKRFNNWLEKAEIKVERFDFSKHELYFNSSNASFKILEQGITPPVDLIEVTHNHNYRKLADSLNYEMPQYGFKKHGGHYAGSCDGKVYLPTIRKPLLLECKTNKKGTEFNKLMKNGVRAEKKLHFSQICAYGYELDLDYSLYLNTCKDDDELHAEIVEVDKKEGERLSQKAEYIILATDAPPRLSDNPSYWKCKMCDANKICFNREPVTKNCRSCAHSQPVDNNQWYCKHWQGVIPKEFIKKGCEEHKSINI